MAWPNFYFRSYLFLYIIFLLFVVGEVDNKFARGPRGKWERFPFANYSKTI
jgi:hypothetical protein